MIACMCLCLHIYIYIYAGKWMSSCTCVRVVYMVSFFVCIHVYEYITVFFYGVAGKEDRKIKQLNEK